MRRRRASATNLVASATNLFTATQSSGGPLAPTDPLDETEAAGARRRKGRPTVPFRQLRR